MASLDPIQHSRLVGFPQDQTVSHSPLRGLGRSTLQISRETQCGNIHFFTPLFNCIRRAWNWLLSFFCFRKKAAAPIESKPPIPDHPLLSYLKNPSSKITSEEIQKIMESGADLTAKNAEGEDALGLTLERLQKGNIDLSQFREILNLLNCTKDQATELLQRLMGNNLASIEWINCLILNGADPNTVHKHHGPLLSFIFKMPVTVDSSEEERKKYFDCITFLINHPEFKATPENRFLIQMLDKFTEKRGTPWNVSWTKVAEALIQHPAVFEERDEENRDPLEFALFKMEHSSHSVPFYIVARCMIDSSYYDVERFFNLFYYAKNKMEKEKSISDLKTCWQNIRTGAYQKLPPHKREEIQREKNRLLIPK